MTLTIRQLQPSDVAVLRDLLDLFGNVFEDTATYCSAQPDDAYLERLLGGESFIAVAALSDDQVVAGLAAYELPKFEQARSEIYIYDLAVRNDWRRKGIATGLIDQLRPIAAERGARVIFVQADRDDPPPIALYSRLGTRETVLHFDIAVGPA